MRDIKKVIGKDANHERRMKIVLTVFSTLISTVTIAQVDTCYRGDYSSKTIIHTTPSQEGRIKKSKTKKKNTDNNYSNKKNHDLENQEEDSASIYRLCWQKYYVDGKLFSEGLTYSDCALGKYTEYYPSGKIRAIKYFKTNDTNDWTNFPCSPADGSWTYYREDGTIEKVETYKDGQLVE